MIYLPILSLKLNFDKSTSKRKQFVILLFKTIKHVYHNTTLSQNCQCIRNSVLRYLLYDLKMSVLASFYRRIVV